MPNEISKAHFHIAPLLKFHLSTHLSKMLYAESMLFEQFIVIVYKLLSYLNLLEIKDVLFNNRTVEFHLYPAGIVEEKAPIMRHCYWVTNCIHNHFLETITINKHFEDKQNNY